MTRGRPIRLLSLLLVLAFAVGIQSVETVRLRGGLTLEPLGTSPLTLQGSAGGERYSLVVALREEAPGARIVLDPGALGTQFTPAYLRALADASNVGLHDLHGVSAERPAWTRSGVSRQGDWELLLDPDRDGPVETLLIVRKASGIEVIDAALVPSFTVPERNDRPAPRWLGMRLEPSERVSWTVAVDAALLMWLLVVGGLLMPLAGLTTALRVPLALIAGAGWVAGVGVLHLPGVLGPVGATFAALGVRRLLARRGVRTGWATPDALWLAGGALLFAALAALVRARGLLVVSPDSFDYWTTAYALSGAELALADLDLKRPAGLATLFSPGFTLGAEGLLSLGPAILVASAAVLVALPRVLGARSMLAPLLGATLAGLALSSAMLLTMAFYLNTHVLAAAFLLLVGVFGVLNHRGIVSEAAAATPVIAVLAGLIMLRAEAIVLIGLVLVGTISMSTRGRRNSGRAIVWSWAARSSGAVLAAVGGVHVSATWGITGRLSLPELLIGVAGIGIACTPGLLERSPLPLLRALPPLVGTLLWFASAMLMFTPLGEGVRFLEAARANLWDGAGRWGITAPLLLALAAAAVLGSSSRSAAVPRWMVIGFVPSAVFAKLLDGSQGIDRLGGLGAQLLTGGGRVGWGDSVNRMWTHIVLVVLLLALVAIIERSDAPTGPAWSHRDWRRWIVFVIVGSIVVFEIMRWQPPEIARPAAPESVALAVEPADGRRLAEPVQFSDGTRWSAAINLPVDPEASDMTRRVALCVDLVLSTLGRAQVGSVEIDLSASVGGASLRTSRLDRAASQSDMSPTRSCLWLESADLAEANVTLRLRGIDGPAGESLAVLPGPDGSLARATLLSDAPELDDRPRSVRFAAALLRGGPFGAGAALLLLLGAPRLGIRDAPEAARRGS